jgi:hypothetical protein
MVQYVKAWRLSGGQVRPSSNGAEPGSYQLEYVLTNPYGVMASNVIDLTVVTTELIVDHDYDNYWGVGIDGGDYDYHQRDYPYSTNNPILYVGGDRMLVQLSAIPSDVGTGFMRFRTYPEGRIGCSTSATGTLYDMDTTWDLQGVSNATYGFYLVGLQPVTNCSVIVEYWQGDSLPYGYAFMVDDWEHIDVAPVKVDIAEGGIVTGTGTTATISFHLTSDSCTNCSWEICPDRGPNGALFASGPDGIGESLYTTGTQVWISAGTLVTDYTIRVLANECVESVDYAGLLVHSQPSWTPVGSSIYVWQPVNDDMFSSSFLTELTNHYQGWNMNPGTEITRYMDPSTNDDNCGDCTLDNLRNMINGGIIVLFVHGNTGVVEVARFLSQPTAQTWIGSDTNYLMVSPGPGSETNYWSVLAHRQWFVTNWKTTLDTKRAIVFLESCHSADGDEMSIASGIGGETVFGISGEPAGVIVDCEFRALGGVNI